MYDFLHMYVSICIYIYKYVSQLSIRKGNLNFDEIIYINIYVYYMTRRENWCIQVLLYVRGRQMILSEKYLPKIVPPTEQKVGLGVECGAHFAEPAVATRALEAVLVPILIKCFQ